MRRGRREDRTGTLLPVMEEGVAVGVAGRTREMASKTRNTGMGVGGGVAAEGGEEMVMGMDVVTTLGVVGMAEEEVSTSGALISIDSCVLGEYGGSGGGGRREEARYSEESDGQKRTSSSGNAWAKGKPPSLSGGQKPIILKRKVEEESPVSHGNSSVPALH